MAYLSPFTITVYDRDYRRRGWVGKGHAASFTVRHHGLDSGTITVPPTDPILAHLLREGARVVVEYRGAVLMSGQQWGADGSVLDNRPVTVRIQGDWSLMNVRAYIDPDQPAASAARGAPAQQGEGGYYRWSAASRETAVRELLLGNLVRRLRQPVTAAADGRRGGAPRALPQVRMMTLAEAAVPVLTEGGLRLRLVQQPGARTIGIELSEVRARPLDATAANGRLVGGDWSLNPPEATRATVGGPGDLDQRAFMEMRDAALEQRWGTVVEVFKDATSAKTAWPDGTPDDAKVAREFLLSGASDTAKAEFSAVLLDSLTKALQEGAPTTSLAVELAEAEGFQFGGIDGVQTGDPVRIVARGEPFVEPITAATVTYSRSGRKVSLQTGERKGDPTVKLAQAVGTIARSQVRLSASR